MKKLKSNLSNQKTNQNEPCICGSGVKFSQCCMNKTEKTTASENPIEKLISMGKDVKMNEDCCVEVRVTKPSNAFLGIFVNPDAPVFEKSVFIPISCVVDYNSIWEITRTGWDSDDRPVFPYICVDHRWIRWDDKTLRGWCGLLEWDEKNRAKFLDVLIADSRDLL